MSEWGTHNLLRELKDAGGPYALPAEGRNDSYERVLTTCVGGGHNP